VFVGGERALRLLRFVDSGGGGPRRLARSDVLERLDEERWRCSIVMSSSKKELRKCTEAMRWHDALPRGCTLESPRSDGRLLSSHSARPSIPCVGVSSSYS
jgi:hypothetical protein